MMMMMMILTFCDVRRRALWKGSEDSFAVFNARIATRTVRTTTLSLVSFSFLSDSSLD